VERLGLVVGQEPLGGRGDRGQVRVEQAARRS
jgi:hypothetical protein